MHIKIFDWYLLIINIVGFILYTKTSHTEKVCRTLKIQQCRQ